MGAGTAVDYVAPPPRARTHAAVLIRPWNVKLFFSFELFFSIFCDHEPISSFEFRFIQSWTSAVEHFAIIRGVDEFGVYFSLHVLFNIVFFGFSTIYNSTKEGSCL